MRPRFESWDEDHHRFMMHSAWDTIRLRDRQVELAACLESYDINRPVTVCAPDGPVFTL